MGAVQVATLHRLVRWQDPVPGDAPAARLAARFRRFDDLDTVVVRRVDGTLGAASRDVFFADMTGELGFGWALNARRPVAEMLRDEPMVRCAGDRLLDVGLDLLDGGGSGHFDDIVVTDCAGRYGTVGIGEIYRAIGREFRQRAIVDDLTGLLNRRGAMAHLRDVLDPDLDADELAAYVLFVDLDRFKLVNDAFGHAAGDAVIKESAFRLLQHTPSDVVCARVGGDEFLVILPASSSRGVVGALAERLGAEFSLPFDIGGQNVGVGATIGVADARHGMDTSEVLRRADMAMYDGKRRGGNCVATVGPSDLDQLTELARLEAALPGAIARCEIVAAYQPEISLDSGAVLGMEALARWRSDDRDISPGVFIPIAERSGQIPSITDLMLDLAAADLHARDRQQGAGPNPPFVAVNASASHCATSGFACSVLRRLESNGLDPQRLVLEVTESVVFDHIDRIIDSATELARHGVRVVLDDFGSGYSSLAVLARLPLSGVKLDRSLLVDVAHDDRARTTVAAIVELGHRFGLYIVAEGVETSAQHDAVVEVGCDVGQGFLYGAPTRTMPVFGVDLPTRRSLSLVPRPAVVGAAAAPADR